MSHDRKPEIGIFLFFTASLGVCFSIAIKTLKIDIFDIKKKQILNEIMNEIMKLNKEIKTEQDKFDNKSYL